MSIMQRLFHILSGISLVISLCLTLLWIRSFWRFDSIQLFGRVLGGGRTLDIDSIHGLLAIDYSYMELMSTSTWGYFSGDVPSARGGVIYWRIIKGHDWWQRIFFSGYIYNQGGNGEEIICFFVSCPHWLLVFFASILPAIWLWQKRRKGGNASKLVTGEKPRT